MFRLSQLISQLRAMGYADAPTDSTLRRWIASGRMPMIIVKRGRYYWRAQDIPEIVESLELMPPTTKAA